MDLWSQVVDVIGISAVVSGAISTAVSYAFDRLKSRSEREAARVEEHLKYSIENYPKFAAVLTDAADALWVCDGLNYRFPGGAILRDDLDRSFLDLLYFLGDLYGYVDAFQSKQGQMFRLGNQEAEMTAEALYNLSKQDVILSNAQQTYLAQLSKEKTLKEFRKFAADDPEVKRIINGTIIPLLSTGIQPVLKDMKVLARLLVRETDAIRVPGYKRKLVPMSDHDSEYQTAAQRIPELWLFEKKDGDYSQPVMVGIYNKWLHDIIWDKDDVQFRVSKLKQDGTFQDITTIDIIDPKDPTRQKHLKILSGQTLYAEWKHPTREEGGEWRITYLPDVPLSSTYVRWSQLAQM